MTGYFKYLKIKNAEIQIKTQFIEYKYMAPKKNLKLLSAKPYPAVQRGGIRAVASATPGMGFSFSTRVIAMAPTKPPKKAIRIT